MAKKDKINTEEKPIKEVKENLVTLKVLRRYSDGELKRIVKPNELIQVSPKRAKEILSHKDKLAVLVEIKQ